MTSPWSIAERPIAELYYSRPIAERRIAELYWFDQEYRELLAHERKYLMDVRARNDDRTRHAAASCARIGRYIRTIRAIQARLDALQ